MCEGKRRGASLVGNKESSLAANTEVKERKILSTKVAKRVFGIINVCEETLKIEIEFMKKLKAD